MRTASLIASLSILSTFAFAQAPAPTAKLPDATTVAQRIGQTVAFQDEVKAVSYSRTSKGYYISFGAPWPKQSLSVWMDNKQYDLLPNHSSMVGRNVRVSGGPIEKTPDGPLIKLAASEQFQVMPTDESILTKPTLDGKQERAQFKSAVWQVFERGDFNTLEGLSQDLQQSRERLNDGSWLSEAFLASFRLGVKTSNQRYAEVEQLLMKWERDRPASIVLPLIKAGYHIDLAWHARGNGYAKTVTPEGWEIFKKELGVTRQILESHPAAKVFPEYFSLMQTVAMGQGWPREKYEQLFSEAIRGEPDYYEYYCHKAYYLLPRWHGKKGEWEQFAEQVRQRFGAGGAGDALYARIVMSQCEFYDALFKESAASWENVASGYEYLIREHPGSRYLKSYYANICWRESDKARLRKALPAMRDDPDMTVWVNLENVAHAEKFAASDRE